MEVNEMRQQRQENLPATIQLIDPDQTTTNKIFVTINGQDWQKDLTSIGLTFDATEREIMDAVVPIIREEFNEDIRNLYKIRKAVNTQNIYILPNSTAGVSSL